MVRRLMVVFAMSCSVACGQQTIGTVGVQDATVAGALVVSNGRAVLVGNTTVTAGERTAEVSLSRGGKVLVCATSGLHVTAGTGDAGDMPLMLALDRGAIEVQTTATKRDSVMTPDLRFTLEGDGPLDLQLRVTRNGDTCVENRGSQAPVVHIADQFGEATYELHAGQHVLFEHGSLREVVDHESSSCGCPPEPTMSVADAILHSGTGGQAADVSPAKKAEAEHPFPAAVSAGLATTAAVPQAPAGEIHTQVAATLSSNAAGVDSVTAGDSAGAVAGGSGAGSSAGNAAVSASPSQTAAPVASPPPSNGIFHAVGRFFRRIFGGG
jgi:hypothetical protein